MKTTTFMAVVAILFLLSCQKAQQLTQNEKDLNLQAPSGQQIAASIFDLKANTAKAIFSKTGRSTGFEMLSVEYLPITKGYAAVVTFQLSDGSIGNYLTLSGVRYQQMRSAIRVFFADSAIEGGRVGEGSFVCVKGQECTANCYSKPKMIFENDQFKDFDCGCSGNCDTKQVE